jgi:shikimate kinase
MNLILFGFKGSGKTHFGKLLATQMQLPFLDTDELVQEMFIGKEKRSPKEIRETLGEEGFRNLETKAISLLKNSKNSIIALGGGAVLRSENVAFLQTIGELVFLKADPLKIKRRMLEKGIPSFLDKNDFEGSFWKMVQQREPIYQAIQAHLCDTDLLNEEEVLTRLKNIFLSYRFNGL